MAPRLGPFGMSSARERGTRFAPRFFMNTTQSEPNLQHFPERGASRSRQAWDRGRPARHSPGASRVWLVLRSHSRSSRDPGDPGSGAGGTPAVPGAALNCPTPERLPTSRGTPVSALHFGRYQYNDPFANRVPYSGVERWAFSMRGKNCGRRISVDARSGSTSCEARRRIRSDRLK